MQFVINLRNIDWFSMFIYCDINTSDVVKVEKSVTKVRAESKCFQLFESFTTPELLISQYVKIKNHFIFLL